MGRGNKIEKGGEILPKAVMHGTGDSITMGQEVYQETGGIYNRATYPSVDKLADRKDYFKK